MVDPNADGMLTAMACSLPWLQRKVLGNGKDGLCYRMEGLLESRGGRERKTEGRKPERK